MGAFAFALVACSPATPTGFRDYAGHWTSNSNAPLSQGITGLDIEQNDRMLSGTMYLSGRALQGSGALTARGFKMSFPAENPEFVVNADAPKDDTLHLRLDIAVSGQRIDATLARTR